MNVAHDVVFDLSRSLSLYLVAGLFRDPALFQLLVYKHSRSFDLQHAHQSEKIKKWKNLASIHIMYSNRTKKPARFL